MVILSHTVLLSARLLFSFFVSAPNSTIALSNLMSNIKNIDFTQYIGKDLGGVTVLRELGRGNMGIVFVAFQRSLKRQVAVKALPKALAHNTRASEQFRDEAEIIAGLSHPNVIPIFEMGENEDVYFQVMQLVNGSDLRTIIKNRLKYPVPSKRVLPILESVGIMIQVLDGLAFAHDEGIIHQDVKPANILMEVKTKRPLILDFGIARTAQMEYSSGGMIVGTPSYLSPEQARTEQTDARTDVYSAGVVLYEMLAGSLPMRKEKVRDLLLRKINQPDSLFIQSPSTFSPHIDSDMEKILLKATAGSLDARYSDCRAFQQDLVRYRDTHLRSF